MNLVVKARRRNNPREIEEREGQQRHRVLQATIAPTAGSPPAGSVAANFTLHVTPDQTLTLSDLLGRRVILALYPADWSPVRIRTRISPSPATSARQHSENKLQGQLHVERLTRTDTRRAIVVADCVGALTKSAEEVAARRRKVQAVEDIEHFQAELSFQALGHRNVLEYREVHRSKARASELIAAHRPEASLRRILKRRRVHPLHVGMADQRMRNPRVCVADLVTTVGVLPRAAGIGVGMNGEGKTGA